MIASHKSITLYSAESIAEAMTQHCAVPARRADKSASYLEIADAYIRTVGLSMLSQYHTAHTSEGYISLSLKELNRKISYTYSLKGQRGLRWFKWLHDNFPLFAVSRKGYAFGTAGSGNLTEVMPLVTYRALTALLKGQDLRSLQTLRDLHAYDPNSELAGAVKQTSVTADTASLSAYLINLQAQAESAEEEQQLCVWVSRLLHREPGLTDSVAEMLGCLKWDFLEIHNLPYPDTEMQLVQAEIAELHSFRDRVTADQVADYLALLQSANLRQRSMRSFKTAYALKQIQELSDKIKNRNKNIETVLALTAQMSAEGNPEVQCHYRTSLAGRKYFLGVNPQNCPKAVRFALLGNTTALDLNSSMWRFKISYLHNAMGADVERLLPTMIELVQHKEQFRRTLADAVFQSAGTQGLDLEYRKTLIKNALSAIGFGAHPTKGRSAVRDIIRNKEDRARFSAHPLICALIQEGLTVSEQIRQDFTEAEARSLLQLPPAGWRIPSGCTDTAVKELVIGTTAVYRKLESHLYQQFESVLMELIIDHLEQNGYAVQLQVHDCVYLSSKPTDARLRDLKQLIAKASGLDKLKGMSQSLSVETHWAHKLNELGTQYALTHLDKTVTEAVLTTVISRADEERSARDYTSAWAEGSA